MNTKTLKVVLTGQVQKVGFRYWIEKEANQRGLSGWVRNRKDGSVEMLLHGEEHRVDDMTRACRHGPAGARVDKVSTELVDFDDSQGFSQKETL